MSEEVRCDATGADLSAQMDELELAKAAMEKADEAQREEELGAEIERNNAKNVSLTETDVHMFGDRTVIAEIVQLLAYIRHAVKNNLQTEIRVRVGGTVVNSELMFDVNGCQVPDLRTQPEIDVN